MKFTLNWLREFLDFEASLTEICEKLTDIGLEVEEVFDKAKDLKQFKAVEVLAAKKHPNADKLQICRVKTLQGEIELVCGAPNARAGIKAVLAPVGSVVPANGMEVKKAKIRGVESIGMLCSAAELGLGADSDGIIELDKDAKLGESVVDLWGLDDPVIEVAITPNRGDCLGVAGVARDLAAAGIGKLKKREAVQLKITDKTKIKLKVNSKNCSQFNLRKIAKVKNTNSPDWLMQRLEAIGISPKSAIVDVTNYVAYCFGQPLHAYDAAKITGGFEVVDAAREAEFLALNEVKYKVQPKMLLVKDAKNILALAGIMGGFDSGTDLESKDIILEAANFNPDNIAQTGRKLALDSDSRYRFERSVDCENVSYALDYATKLITDICGGDVCEVSNYRAKKFKAREINFSYDFLTKLAGFEIDKKQVDKIFQSLGFKIAASGKDSLKVTVPSWRNDVWIIEDLCEEVIRIFGLNNIPNQEFKSLERKALTPQQIANMQARRLVCSLGFDDVVTWSFADSEYAKKFNADAKFVEVENPISSDLDIMRFSILPNLLQLAARNSARGNPNNSLAEIGKVFLGIEPQEQKDVYALLRSGTRAGPELNNDASEFDFFDIKSDVEQVIAAYGFAASNLQISCDNLPDYLHPGRAAFFKLGKQEVAIFGQLHPVVAKNFDLKANVFVAEVFLDNIPLSRNKIKEYQRNDLQKVKRDFAFIVDEKILAADIIREIYKARKDLIDDVVIFDYYQGDNIDKGKKSLAFNVSIQPLDKNLTGEEIDLIADDIIDNVTNKFAAKLR
jgi:phenylalanyl-tRNA synthetase beta chain